MDKMKIKAIRVNAGKLQKECADYIHMPLRTYREKEATNTFSLFDADRLAKYLGVDIGFVDPIPISVRNDIED